MAVAARRVEELRPVRRPLRPLRPVRRTAPRTVVRPRRVPFMVLALVVVAAMVVGLVAAQALVAQGAFRVDDLRRRADRLEEDYGRLRLRAAELSSPGRVARVARRAGLVLPERVEVVAVPAADPGRRANPPTRTTGPAE